MRNLTVNGVEVNLPSNIYPFRDRYFRLSVSVIGIRKTLGTWADPERAILERNRALARLSTWLRSLPDDVPPLADQPGLPPNPLLLAFEAELRHRAPGPFEQGRVAPTATEAVEAPKEDRGVWVSRARLASIEAKLDILLQRTEPHGK
jgi:hypothetical protein